MFEGLSYELGAHSICLDVGCDAECLSTYLLLLRAGYSDELGEVVLDASAADLDGASVGSSPDVGCLEAS